MIIDIPQIHCQIKSSFILEDLLDASNRPYTEAYAYSVTAIQNRPLLFNLHTVHGALYSRVPLWALSWKEPEAPLKKEEIDPWGVIGSRIQVIQHAYLKGYCPIILKHPGLDTYYLMSFDWFEGGFSEDPEQSKTMHLLQLRNGQYGLFPNNELLFIDNHFTSDEPIPKYKRNTTYFAANG